MRLAGLPRLWPTIDLPGISHGGATYWTVDLDEMPPIERRLDGSLDWLLDTPAHASSLERGPDDRPEREADAEGLRAVLPNARLPEGFRRFIEDPEPRRHIRSATACYMDLGHFAVRVDEGGALIHFLSDQQWVLHWLLYVGPEASETVIATPDSFGFDDGESEPIQGFDATDWPDTLSACADSFEQFLYHYWAMNELFHRLSVDHQRLDDLPEELRNYAIRYPRKASSQNVFREGRVAGSQ